MRCYRKDLDKDKVPDLRELICSSRNDKKEASLPKGTDDSSWYNSNDGRQVTRNT